MDTPILTEAQRRALEHAAQNKGCVFAGWDVTRSGARVSFSAAAIRALASKGFVTLSTADTTMGTITDAGRAALKGEGT